MALNDDEDDMLDVLAKSPRSPRSPRNVEQAIVECDKQAPSVDEAPDTPSSFTLLQAQAEMLELFDELVDGSASNDSYVKMSDLLHKLKHSKGLLSSTEAHVQPLCDELELTASSMIFRENFETLCTSTMLTPRSRKQPQSQ